MARIRTIKPEFFTSEDIVSLSPLARLLYVALWCEADREGRLVWRPRTFKLRYLPADNCDADALCQELIDGGLVVLYGDDLAYIPSFARHQHLNPRESASTLPEPDAKTSRKARKPIASARVVDASARVDDAQGGREGKGRERKGKEGEEQEAPTVLVNADGVAPYRVPPCDHKGIVNAYAAALPRLPQVAVLTETRKSHMQARWREVCGAEKLTAAEALDYFAKFFAYVGESSFLTGAGPPRKDTGKVWRADLEWLMQPGKFAKVIEGAYHDKRQQA